MFEQKLTERVTHNKKEREKRHHLLHALKVAKKSYKVYDECEQTMKCPINKYGKKQCRLDLTKCDLNEAMQFNHKFFKVKRGNSSYYWKKRENYCKRLVNMANLKPSLKAFLNAKYKAAKKFASQRNI